MQNSYPLKINSLKLKEGKCQIRFFIRLNEQTPLKGYALVEPKVTLKEVVADIQKYMEAYQAKGINILPKRKSKRSNYYFFI